MQKSRSPKDETKCNGLVSNWVHVCFKTIAVMQFLISAFKRTSVHN